MTDPFSYVTSDNKVCSYLTYLALTLGALQILSWVYSQLSFLYRHLIKKEKDLIATYGQKDTWAVVTGGSDGIGEQFCHDLAEKGFNICIIARNEKKMQEKLAQISHGKKIKTRYVVGDLAALTKYSDYAKIADQIKDIDISILILNAGWTCMGPFASLTPDEVEQTVTINALHPVYLIKALLPQLLKRDKRTGVIVMSSGLGSCPVPGVISYSAAKAFASYLAQGLAVELKDKMDFLSYECGEVKTKLIGKNRKGFHVITTDRATGAGLRDLGTLSVTNGGFAHDLAMRVLPKWLLQKMVNKVSLKTYQKYRANLEAEKKGQ
ncbi:hypothetical protein FGO68_gene12765 [Halteria grandinella]|uniref:Uncharacterized protein n=1 Tax=Halteria grandinella TaxID=5974 RepID=A0A8J8T0C2_HALGN|nr:hypothetical protein FGO68_gene12765 [Halteria grandinella]